MVIVAWLVTPLQNGIFVENAITLRRQQRFNITSTASGLTKVPPISGEVLNIAYSSVWLGQPLPPFTTAKVAIAPFAALDPPKLDHSSASNLTANTIGYSVDLVCHKPAKISLSETTVTFDDGNGCVAQDMITYPDTEDSQKYAAYYFGYADDPRVDNSLQLGGCGESALHKSLVIWKRTSRLPPDFSNPDDAVALFCTPSFFQQQVQATVSALDGSIVGLNPISLPEKVPVPRFNQSEFELLINAGSPFAVRSDISQSTTVHQDSRLLNISLVVPAPNIIGFAVGLSQYHPADYLQPGKLQNALEQAHRLTFGLAMSNTMPRLSAELFVAGETLTSVQAVSIARVFAISTQAFLFIVLIFTCCLFNRLRRRRNLLYKDPSTLADVISSCATRDLATMITNCDGGGARNRISVSADQYLILTHDETLGATIRPADVDSTSTSISQPKRPDDENEGTGRKADLLPIWRSAGMVLAMYLAGAIVALVVLQNLSDKDEGMLTAMKVYASEIQLITSSTGIPLPSQSSLIQQILLNLIPTGFATLLEPFWALLSRLICLVTPLEVLAKGNANASQSFLLEYASIPSQLVTWKALKSRHYVLALICFVALLANILTVTLSGLFYTQLVDTSYFKDLRPQFSLDFKPQGKNFDQILSNHDQYDAFYVALANLTNSTSLPPWTDRHHYFMPLHLDSVRNASSTATISMQARGYGAQLTCHSLNSISKPVSLDISFNENYTTAALMASAPQPDGTVHRCKPWSAVVNEDGTANFTGTSMQVFGQSSGKEAIEFADRMVPLLLNNPKAEVDYCSSLLVKGWGRLQGENSNSSAAARPSFDSTFIACQAIPVTALFNITITKTGSVLSAIPITPTTSPSYLYTNLSAPLKSVTQAVADLASPTWHNDTIASDWTNDLIKRLTQSPALLDSSLPPPTPSTAIKLTSEIYTRLFAIQLSLFASPSNPQFSPAAPDTPPIRAVLHSPERRIFLNQTLYLISLSILILNLLTAIIFYTTRPHSNAQAQPLPHFPGSIASQMQFFLGSRIAEDVVAEMKSHAAGAVDDENIGKTKETFTEALARLDREKGWRYGYGRFVGWNGMVHTGVEREPFVIR